MAMAMYNTLASVAALPQSLCDAAVAPAAAAVRQPESMHEL
jgi:hypothetical protein